MQTVNAAKNPLPPQQRHVPAALAVSLKIRHWLRLRYMNFATAVKARSLVLFRLGQMLAWSARVARRHPAASAGFLVAITALVALPAFSAFWPYRAYLWTAASLIGISGAAMALGSAAQQALLRLMDVMRAEMATNARWARHATDRRIAGLETQVAGLGAEVDQKLRKEIIGLFEPRLNKIFGEIGALRKDISEMGGAVNKQGRIASSEEQNVQFQRFNRVLKPEHIEVLHTVWSKRLGVHTTKPMLAYMAHRIRMTEQIAVGRLATQIEDAVLRTLVSSAVQAKTLEVLEIGTLFGIGLAMLYELNHARYDNVHVTAIDPLEGYYGEKVPDRLLNIPVTKTTFWRNMDMLGVPREDITLIEDLSTSDRAIGAAKLKRYDVLVIDGDHSYAGVKADFENYLGMMRQGGFIIFDDYNATDWPDVKRFVDEEVKGREDLALVGAEWRTAIFRVVKTSTEE